MSTNLAFALPRQQPHHQNPQSQPRHIEIVTTRNQRRARPRLAYSLIVIAGLFAVLAAQLLLSIALADGAYQISALQSQQKELNRAQQAVTEQLNVLNSPQNLAARAESLGMVSNNSAVYLNLADGAVMGSPSAASAGAGSVIGANGSLLIANSLLTNVPGTMEPSTDAVAGAPLTGQPDSSVPSTTTGIPGPTTR
jgi:cell division protein FtsB